MAAGREPSDRERAVLVGVAHGGLPRSEVEDHLDELGRLVDTAGGQAVARLVQERREIDPATLVGSGFVGQIAEACTESGARTVVFDEDLTGSQVRNLEQGLPKDIKVLDRAGVILDIFAQRARTREAQTQVELAQLTYLLSRLTRRWRHLSRQAGGIGTRGVGETQLELDRRLITRRITQLRKKLSEIEATRRLRRQRRTTVPTVALVGYTNAGKSSLFRRLTRARVLVEDRLFATLDPRARRVALGDGVAAILTDTVGFIRKLPHDLVAPFRSTLEEAARADLVLHVVDVSDGSWEEHLRVGDEVLEGLGVDPERVLVVLNKVDLVGTRRLPPILKRWITVSALTAEGIPRLKDQIRVELLGAPSVAVLSIPLEEGEAVARAFRLPHRVARRFGEDSVTIAVRAGERDLAGSGLERFLLSGWPVAGVPWEEADGPRL